MQQEKQIIATIGSTETEKALHICRDHMTEFYYVFNGKPAVLYKGVYYNVSMQLWHEGSCCICKGRV
jgi:hypothetical protein